MKDRNQALAYLNELQMHPKDTITNFIQKFRWTNSGGSLSFHGTTCKIAYQDAKNPATQFSMNLYVPFSPNDTAHHLVRPTAAFAKVDIPSDLLH